MIYIILAIIIIAIVGVVIGTVDIFKQMIDIKEHDERKNKLVESITIKHSESLSLQNNGSSNSVVTYKEVPKTNTNETT